MILIFKKLNFIHYKALKIINRRSIYCSLSDISTNIETLFERADTWKIIKGAFINNNELVIELSHDFTEMKIIQKITILCRDLALILNIVQSK